ncbi:MAG TPA: hypothetical protein VIV11_05630 [Kofleriaceae bacterium]
MKPRTTRSLTLLLALAVAATPAAAGPDATKSPASDHIMSTKGEVTLLERELKKDLAADEKARRWVGNHVKNITAGIARIRKADPSWDVRAWEQLLQQAQAALAKAESAAAGATVAANQVEDVFRRYRDVATKEHTRFALELLTKVAADPTKIQMHSEQILGSFATNIAGLADLDKLCRETGIATMRNAKQYPYANPPPADACKLAAQRRELGERYVEHQARSWASHLASSVEKAIEAVAQGESIEIARHDELRAPAQLVETNRATFDKAVAPLGVTADPAAFEPIIEAAKGYAAAIGAATKTSRWQKDWKRTDAAITALVKQEHAKGGTLDEGKVVKIGSPSEWSVKRNEFDRIVSREFSRMYVLVQIKGESHCRLYMREFSAGHDGKKFGKPGSTRGLYTFQFSSCK